MKLRCFDLLKIAALLYLMSTPASAQDKIPCNIAFGLPTRGGSGGKIIRVVNLHAEGPGSLKQAVGTRGPRIIVFEVGGVINLAKTFLEINDPYITIAGQTAPSPGITIIRGGMLVKTHDVIIQHIRIRPGDAGEKPKSGWEPDGLTTSGGNAYNIIIDHCSFTWSIDENLSASGPRTLGPDSTSHKITFSNNIIGEGLFNSSHSKGIHSMGTLVHDFVRDIAIVGNLYTCNNQRNAFFKAHTLGVFANNVIYNPGSYAIQLFYAPAEWVGLSIKPENCKISIVGNVMYKGVDTKDSLAMVIRQGDAYMHDNAAYELNGRPAPLTAGEIRMLSERPSWPTGFTALPAKVMPDYIVHHAGARPRDRDEIDQRIIRNFIDRTGRLINSQEEVGGYPDYPATCRKLQVPEKNVDKWLRRLAANLE
jgi:pectate lyase